jgi:hypothetical protein
VRDILLVKFEKHTCGETRWETDVLLQNNKFCEELCKSRVMDNGMHYLAVMYVQLS